MFIKLKFDSYTKIFHMNSLMQRIIFKKKYFRRMRLLAEGLENSLIFCYEIYKVTNYHYTKPFNTRIRKCTNIIIAVPAQVAEKLLHNTAF